MTLRSGAARKYTDTKDYTYGISQGPLGIFESSEKILAAADHHLHAAVRGSDRADRRLGNRAIYLRHFLVLPGHNRSANADKGGFTQIVLFISQSAFSSFIRIYLRSIHGFELQIQLTKQI